jgi:predicted ATP-dependent protease
MMSLSSTVSLRPEAIPLDVKVVLIGDASLYYLLTQHDPDFRELFKVPIDFDDRMPVSDETITLYARLIATQVRKMDLLPLDRGAVAQVLERMTRLAGDAERLSNHSRSLLDLLLEADHWANDRGAGLIAADDVKQAVKANIHRSDRLRERTQEQIERGTIIIDTSGEAVGQINALSVLQLGDFAFGRPSRVTARVRLGRGRVVDIEREVELGGPLHSKGVLILSNYLAARFTQNQPLSLNASLVFEQSYGGIDGDSASSTELYALLSALAEAPIKQSLAVTGSVNQFGEVQAIGGANEKIEGFFDLCRQRGLTGDQGVLIPAANVKHLMLKEDVVEAAEQGKFHIYPVATIDQGIELLTGMAAGEADQDGAFPADCINGRVQARLRAFAQAARDFAKAGGNGKSGERNDG